MKINHSLFKSAVDAVSPFVQTRSMLPILSHVKLESTGSHLIFTASSIDSQIEHSIECSGELFSITVEAVALNKFAQFCTEDIILSVNNDKVNLKSGGAKIRVNVLDARDFPLVEKSENIIAELDWSVLRDKIAFAGLFAATADIRHVMNCVQIKSTGTAIDVFGTNGLNLAMESVSYIAPKFGLCIPIDGSKRMAGDFTSFVVREDQVELRGPQSIAIFKLSATKPVDGRRIVDTVLPNVGQITRKSLIDAITFTSAFYDGKLRSIVKIESSDGNSVQLDGRKNEADTIFEYEGEPFVVRSFSSDVSNALKALSGEKIKFEFSSSEMNLRPIRFTDNTKTILVMPVKG